MQAEKQFDDAREKLGEVSLSAAKWRAAKAALDEAQGAEKAVTDELSALAQRRAQLQRVARVATPYAQWKDAVAQREALGTPVAFPEGADALFSTADKTLGDVKVREATIRATIQRQQQELDAIVLSPALTDRESESGPCTAGWNSSSRPRAICPACARTRLRGREHPARRAASRLGRDHRRGRRREAPLPGPAR